MEFEIKGQQHRLPHASGGVSGSDVSAALVSFDVTDNGFRGASKIGRAHV